jgi:signal transduction histidine kinase
MGDIFSQITVREPRVSKKVKISSNSKPDILPQLLSKWQSLIDITAKIVNVPSGLIMKLNESNIEVYLKSMTDGNPYKTGEKADLIYGLYCETVIGTQKELLVPDATKSLVWKDNNPDIDLNMISYLGYPINWPDGEVFGTVCLLDSKENHYNQYYRELLYQLKLHIETDLELLLKNQTLQKSNVELEKMNQIKTKFLSLISHDIRGGMGALNTLIKLSIDHFGEMDNSELLVLLKLINQNISTTHATLENLLDWSKNDMLDIKPKWSELNIVETIEQLIGFFSINIKLKNIEISRDYCSNNVLVIADENMLTAGLRNIISNAVKYCNKGGKIFFRIYKSKTKTSIEIEDTGMGMDKKILDNLFRFPKRNMLETAEEENSAGIGLTITKDLMDKNNAIISVESTLNIGTRFIITI